MEVSVEEALAVVARLAASESLMCYNSNQWKYGKNKDGLTNHEREQFDEV